MDGEKQMKLLLFNRMLIAQSKVENLRLVSNDEILKKYPIEVEWQFEYKPYHDENYYSQTYFTIH